jgi:hypothetical protein
MHYGSAQLKGGASESTQKFSAIMNIITNNKYVKTAVFRVVTPCTLIDGYIQCDKGMLIINFQNFFCG